MSDHPNPGAFRATHRAPEGGITTFASPDPSLPAGPHLEAGLDVQVTQTTPEGWSSIVCSNGWSAWVDGRRLVPAGAAAPPGSGAATPLGSAAAKAIRKSLSEPTRMRTIAVEVPGNVAGWARSPATLGTVGLFLAAILPWLRIKGGGTGNSYDVAMFFLVDKKRLASGATPWDLGLVLTILFVVCGIAALVPKARSWRPYCGGGGALLSVWYIVQVQRVLSDAKGGPSLFSTVGIGTWLCLASSLAVALDRKAAGGGQ